MRYIKNYPINESSDWRDQVHSVVRYFNRSEWLEHFPYSKICKKLISDLRDSLLFLSDDKEVIIEVDIDNDPFIWIICKIDNYYDIKNLNNQGLDKFELFSSEIINISKKIEEGIERSKIDYVEFKMVVMFDHRIGHSCSYRIKINDESYPLNNEN